MTGGSVQLRTFRIAIRDGASLAAAAEKAGMSLGEATLHLQDDAANPPPADAYEPIGSMKPTKGTEMARGKKAAEKPINGEVPQPDFERAINVLKADLNPLTEEGAKIRGDQAAAWKIIEKDCHCNKKAMKALHGLMRMGAPPYGVITGDVDGDNTSGFLRRTGAIIQRVATARGVAAALIDTASLNALDAAVPYDINLVLTEQISVLDLARRLARPCNAQAGLDFQGRLFAVRPTIGAPALTLDAQGRQLPPVRQCQEAEVSAPYKRIMFGANRSWRVHTFDEIAFDAELIDRGDYDPAKTYRRGNIVSLPNGSRWLYVNDTPKAGSLPSETNADWELMTGAITAGNITYEDGTPVEALKPAEPGATDGMNDEERDEFDQLAADTATAQTNIAAAQAQIAAIEGSVAADIGALADQIGSVSASVGELVLEVGAVATDVSALTDNVGTIAADLVALSSQVGTVAIDVDGLKADILAAGGAIASLESNVSTQGASIATLQQATSSIGGDLATLTTRVTAGSANLLRTGGLDAGTLDWATNGVLSLEYSASFGRWLRVTSGAANFFINSLSVQVDPGGAYTASVDTIFEASAGTMIASLVWLNSGGAEVGRVWAGNRGGHSFDNSNAGRATNAASGIAPANAAGALLQVSWNNVAGLVNAGLRQAKIENYSTWTPFSSEASIRSAYTAISTLDTQYAGLSTTVGTQGASIVQNATAITNLTGRTASLESSVSAQGASIVTLQQATSTQGGQIAQLTTDLSTANANIGINATAISTTNTNLAQLTTRVGSAESAVSQNATAISGLNGRTASLESSVSTQGASIVTLQQATSTIGGDLATLTTRVTAGSANLLRTGGLDAGTLDWSSEGTLSLAYSASFGRWLRVTSGAANFFINSTSVQVDPGGVYTASVDTIFQASAGTMIASLIWLNSSGLEVGRALAGNRGGHSFDNVNAGRATNAASGIAPANAAGALLQVSWSNVAGLSNAGLRQAKIENYTTWTPFSSEASIRSAYTAISTLDTQYAGLSTTVGTQGASIVQNATAITNLTGRTALLESSVSAQGASIVTLQQATSTISGDVATLTTRVTASAPNLLPQGGFANGMADWGSPAGWNSSSALDPNWGRYVSVNATGNTYAGTSVQPAQPNQQYTISADIDRGGTSGGAVFARIVWTQAGNVHSVGPTAVKYSGGFSNDEAARVWGAGICPSDANGFYVQLGVEGVTGNQYFRRIKVNVGSYPARFSEEATIVQSFETLSTLTTQYASLSNTVSTQGVSISTQATAISTLQSNVTSLFAKWSLELDVNGYVSGMVTNNNGTRADLTLRMDKVKMVTPSGLGGYWQVIFDGQGRPTQTIGDDASGVMIEIGYLA